jgi:serine/threonine protein kinase
VESFDPNSTRIFTSKKGESGSPTAADQGVTGRAAALETGSIIDNFTIEKVLGIGGFGIVYLAKHNLTDALVAIKEFFPSSMVHRVNSSTVQINTTHDSPSFAAGMESFVKEARTLARLHHAGLVQVLHFWEGNGTAYMVMPYYEGETLKSYMEKPDFATTSTFIKVAFIKNLLTELLPTLEYLHEKNIFHRDIKPDNIFLLKSSKPLLLDFGAARQIVDQAANITTILTEGYAPVEQYDKNGHQGAKTDIYALSAVLYHFITGRAPQASVTRVFNDPVVCLEENYSDHYPMGILKAIDAGLIVDPDKRPSNVTDWKAILENEGKKTPQPIPPVNDVEIISLPERKSKSKIKPILIISFIVIAAAGAFLLKQQNEKSQLRVQTIDLFTQLKNQLEAQHTANIDIETEVKQTQDQIKRSRDNANIALLKLSLLEKQEAKATATITYNALKAKYDQVLSRADKDIKEAAEGNNGKSDKIYKAVQKQLIDLKTWTIEYLKDVDVHRTKLTHTIDGTWALNSCAQNASVWKVEGNLLHVFVDGKEISTEKIIAAFDNTVFTTMVAPSNASNTNLFFEYHASEGKLEVRQGGNKQYLMLCGS